MGYKGDSYMASGYFFCPYIPLTQTPVVLEPELNDGLVVICQKVKPEINEQVVRWQEVGF